MSEKQWQQLLNLIPNQSGAARPVELDLRQVINAIFYVLVTGCQWRNLPNDHPNSVYYHHRKWSKDGTWRKVNQQMLYLERLNLGRIARPSAGIIWHMFEYLQNGR
jgi:transposase